MSYKAMGAARIGQLHMRGFELGLQLPVSMHNLLLTILSAFMSGQVLTLGLLLYIQSKYRSGKIDRNFYAGILWTGSSNDDKIAQSIA